MKLGITIALWVLTAAFSVAQTTGQAASTYMADRQQAVELYKAGKFQQALPLLQKLVDENPADVGIQEAFGYSIWVTSTDLEDPAKRNEACQRARAALLKAKELGDNSNFIQIILPSIPEDCSQRTFSTKKEVDDVMRSAEAAYTRGDLDEAIRGYEKANLLDPKLYPAALFAGDVYYKKKEHEKAAEWFAKAVAIEPNNETALRYWGDDLLSQGRIADAREKYIDALLGWPYDNRPWIGLKQWAEQAKVQLRAVQIKPPSSVQFKENGNANINLDPASLKDDSAGAAWLMYSMTRVVWHNKTFAEKFPDQSYRHTLQEEAEALSNVVASATQIRKDKKLKELDPQLKTLVELKEKGLLEAYVLLSAPDPDIATDYAAYRDANRAKLREYVSTYIVPPAP